MNPSKLLVPAVLGALALTAGCAQPPSADPAAPSAPASSGAAAPATSGFKACMVSDSGGFDDKSFNQVSHKGLTDAKAALGIDIADIESNSEADFSKNVQSMIDAKCNVIITVGFLLEDATLAAAKANPNVEFAIVDSTNPDLAGQRNIKQIAFNTAQSSFLAGYLAAGMSKQGKVATMGGLKIPTVTIFMDGFAEGVKHYNEKKGKNVELLGWDEARQDGQFVPGSNPFENVQGGQQTATTLLSQGADVILPVAGPAGEGALQAVQATGGRASAVWVDTDGCVSAERYCSSILTSVTKGMDLAVEQAITEAKNGNFSNAPYVGTLADGGTGLAPYHDYDAKVPAELKAEVDQLKQQIVSGQVKVQSASQPQ